MKSEPRGPVKILQRQKYASTTIPAQIPRRPRDGKYSQRQLNYEGARYEKELEVGYNPKEKNGPKGMAIERDMVLEKRKKEVSPTSQMGLRAKLIILPKDQEKMVGISQQRVLVVDKMGMREMRVEMIRKKLEIINITLRIKGKERVTQKILMSQVTPGGGVLKIKLSKKRPIKITAGAPGGELDPAQTKFKTIYETINKESEQLPSGVNSNGLNETEQPKEERIPPVRANQPTLGIVERKRPYIPPKRVSGSNANGNGDPDGNGVPMDMVVTHMEIMEQM